jgi:hypothetical protein
MKPSRSLDDLLPVVFVSFALLCSAALAQEASASPAPESTPPPAADCLAIDSEIARAAEARRVAIERSANAWKAVIPVAVLARKASARSALEEADRKLAALKVAAQRCEPAAGPAESAAQRSLQLSSAAPH